MNKSKNASAKSTVKNKKKSSDELAVTSPINKTKLLLSLLRQEEGATIKELQEASGWQAHSVQGFLSGTIKKKLDLNIVTKMRRTGERSYRIVEHE